VIQWQDTFTEKLELLVDAIDTDQNVLLVLADSPASHFDALPTGLSSFILYLCLTVHNP
jgi:hypothetical protein